MNERSRGPVSAPVPGGLNEAEAAYRLKRDGPNELPVSRPRGMLRVAREVASEPMFLLLVACGGIYMVLGDAHEALMLLGFVTVVMAISFFQQRRSERALDALRELASPQAMVLRGATAHRVPARELVVGDVVLLNEGDRVPADMDLVHATDLAIDESLLTGESMPVGKEPSPSRTTEDTSKAFSGTLVTRGAGLGCVIATGARSALGRIGQSLANVAAVSTPIQLETRRIVKQMVAIGLALAGVLVVAHGISRGEWLQGVLAGLTLAMAILPEELPLVLTLFLGLGAWRLAREKVLVKSIPAIERLGGTTVLCVDKTGTLTVNRMSIRRLWSEAAVYDRLQMAGGALQEELHGVLEYAVLASHRRTFDPMEAAIVAAGRDLLAGTEHLHAEWTLVDDYPLSPGMLAMSRVWQSPDQRDRLIAAKGAPEAIVDLCHMDPGRSASVAAQVRAMAQDGLRVLGVAQATFGAASLPEIQHDFEFQFLGLLGLEDPLRPHVAQSIAECRVAGIRVVMMTGDHSATALSVARQAGMQADTPVISGVELASLTDEALAARLADTCIFSRVQPEQKLRIVRAFAARGDVVAMTGDGVNDAPALKAAAIGVAMGARGTEVAREAAALVLLTDDFASLVTAVRYGRRVFANLRKAMVFVIAAHVPIVGLSVLPVLLGWPMLLMPVHIVFLQLIIDPACSMVFEAQPPEPGAMKVAPRPAHQGLFERSVVVRGLWQGAGLLALLLTVYAASRHLVPSDRDEVARTLTFSALVLSNLALIQSNRSWGRSAWRGHGEPTRQFGWIVLGAILLLGVVLAVPAVTRLFAFARPSPSLVLAALSISALSWRWFEFVKRWRVSVGGAPSDMAIHAGRSE
ncbi:Calcium-transporting ATPase [Variovorax sp. PBL-H6]|uniref:cation-translocating P-type ATPase n=1 Tax=Variovorax sp. PBL-H6 TaxID=434009 RepID=UPI0013170140|nr:cation-translocating P-type ATPase [Variovorax sp. PBL-H6]VTU31026.1 Calcium-transporting ATPase [Variovorax sp. PBL-H6]